jgi:hypothetical protein
MIEFLEEIFLINKFVKRLSLSDLSRRGSADRAPYRADAVT